MSKTKTNIFLFTLLFCEILCNPTTAYTQETEIARLRRDNIRLRARVDFLEQELAKRTNRMSSLDGDYNASGFFSLADRWDQFDDPELAEDAALKRVSEIDTILCIPQDDVLSKYIDIYATVRGRNMVRILHRYDRYLPMIKKTFRAYGVPEEFAALAIVESAVNPKAISKAGAVGMWQIMESTAKQYGMKVTYANDERYSVEKATGVAARVLRDAYRRFGDWGLAVMSYNCGPGRIQTALAAVGDDTSYEAIYRQVPRETREYLPALVAAMYVNANRALLLAGVEAD